MSWHIFYTDSTKEIAWSSNAPVTDAIKTEQTIKLNGKNNNKFDMYYR